MAKELTALRLDTELLAAMRRVKDRDGVPLTTQIELALRQWLAVRRALPGTPHAEPTRAHTTKRRTRRRQQHKRPDRTRKAKPKKRRV
jgi:hypothetical protein